MTETPPLLTRARQSLAQVLEGRRAELRLRQAYVAFRARLPQWLVSPAERIACGYDVSTVRIAEACLSPSTNVVDAGAHAGTILKHLVRLAPQGQAFAFEPIPALASALQRCFPDVVVAQVALGDANTTAEFHHVVDNPATSSLHTRPERETGHRVRTLTVQVRRLDDCIPEDVCIGFMKLDVEGAELELLRGATRILTTDRPVVVFECPSRNLPSLAELFTADDMQVRLLAEFDAPDPVTGDALFELALQRGEYYFVALPR